MICIIKREYPNEFQPHKLKSFSTFIKSCCILFHFSPTGPIQDSSEGWTGINTIRTDIKLSVNGSSILVQPHIYHIHDA